MAGSLFVRGVPVAAPNVEITNDQAEVRVIEADDDRVTSKCQQARAWLFGASGCSARAREWPLNAINPESEAAHT